MSIHSVGSMTTATEGLDHRSVWIGRPRSAQATEHSQSGWRPNSRGRFACGFPWLPSRARPRRTAMVGYHVMDTKPSQGNRLPCFGLRLREEREAAGLSQRALARLAGLSPQAVSRLERGVTQTPRWDTIRRLSKALGLLPERLVQWTWRPLAAAAPKSRREATRNARRFLREQLRNDADRPDI